MEAFQTFHGTLPKSLKFFLNPINGKFDQFFLMGIKINGIKILELLILYINMKILKIANLKIYIQDMQLTYVAILIGTNLYLEMTLIIKILY